MVLLPTGVDVPTANLHKDPGCGLKAAKPDGTLSIKECVERGSKDAPSNYIHTTRDLLVAAHFAMSRRGGVRTTSGYRSARTIVAIDLRRLHRSQMN